MEYTELDSGTPIEPNIPHDEVPPIDQRRLLIMFNYWLQRNAALLNSFANASDSTLYELECRIDRIEAALMLLEQKLSSVPWLNDKNQSTEQQPERPASGTIFDESKVTENAEKESIEAPTTSVESPPDDDSTVAARNHPVYGVYFKMIQMGVPVPAVRIKMQSEGVDPDLLDAPEHRMPRPPSDGDIDEHSGSSD